MSEPLLAPRLSAAFAERVLALADRRLTRRRRARWTAGAVCLCLVAGAVFSLTRLAQPPRPSAAPGETAVVADLPRGSGEMGAPPNDTLSYLFPDAAPLSRFAAEDGSTDRNTGAEALFDDQD